MVTGIAIIALIGFLAIRHVVIEACVAALEPKFRQRRAQRQECTRLIGDADYEHWHALFGDERIATHGRFQP